MTPCIIPYLCCVILLVAIGTVIKNFIKLKANWRHEASSNVLRVQCVVQASIRC